MAIARYGRPFRLPSFMLTLVVALFSIPLTFAAGDSFTINQCCLVRAREQLDTFKATPWDTCGIGKGTDIENPVVNASKSWCTSKCTRFDSSSFSQWSDLLTTFVAPALALLIICPIGSPGHNSAEDEDEDEEQRSSDTNRQTGFGYRDEERGQENPEEYDTPASIQRTFIKGEGSATASLLDHNETESRGHRLAKKKRKHGLPGIFYMAQEYVNILGDPASALAGAYSQLFWDIRRVRELGNIKESDPLKNIKEDALRFALLASQTHITLLDSTSSYRDMSFQDIRRLKRVFKAEATKAETSKPQKEDPLLGIELFSPVQPVRPSIVRGHQSQVSVSSAASDQTLTENSRYQRLSSVSYDDAIEEVSRNTSEADTINSSPKAQQTQENKPCESRLRTRLESAIKTLLKAKVDFTNGIVIPAVLTYGGCAAAFYSAYKALGDRDKGFSLSFGVGYAWLLVLAVVSNCYAVTVNSDLLESSLAGILHDPALNLSLDGESGSEVKLHFNPRSVPFRKRILTNHMWTMWIQLVTRDEEATTIGRQRRTSFQWLKESKALFLVYFLLNQVLSWIFVSAFVGCGAWIAYNTPTIGLGCRSFTLILYMVFTLVAALLLWLRALVDGPSILSRLLWWAYAVTTLANATILVGGTALHLIGVFRTCRCEMLFSGGDVSVVLNANTTLDKQVARNLWLPVGYIAFILAWLMSTFAVVLREYIFLSLTGRFFDLHE